MIVRIALPVPLYRLFDYAIPAGDNIQTYPIGSRVLVPFGRQKLVGIIHELATDSEFRDKIKPIITLLDSEPLFLPAQLTLCQWAADYYHAPIGEVYAASLPVLLRQGKACEMTQQRRWALLSDDLSQAMVVLKNAPKQRAAIEFLADKQVACSDIECKAANIQLTTLRQLEKKSWVHTQYTDAIPSIARSEKCKALILNEAQAFSVNAITQALDSFAVLLIDGVTGSGKTEVYLQSIAKVLKAGQQALVLVPEIGLTPQTVSRFASRFDCHIAVLHSRMNDRERLDNYLLAKTGRAQIIIGTRSAIFAPMPNLGLIVIDEEHDASFKQQEGFRYSARDMAIKYAKLCNVPIVLGTATPSLESMHNALSNRFQYLELPQRAGNALMPSYTVIDLSQDKPTQGVSSQLLQAIEQHLDNGNQVLLFLNRRGYAPVLMCTACQFVVSCNFCDAKLSLHHQPRHLLCHHCGATQRYIHDCPQCHQAQLLPIGHGTERLEEYLQQCFPKVPVKRIDQDSTRRKGSFNRLIDEIKQGNPQILLGTQMLAKGHHFADVTLVGIIDADSGLFSVDFRAQERLAQLILQVAGRAGRAKKKGEVIIQSYQPQHPMLVTLITSGYQAFAKSQLEERYAASLPPYSHMALFRSEAKQKQISQDILNDIHQLASNFLNDNVQLLGPIIAPMEKRAEKFRMQLLVKSSHRGELQRLLNNIMHNINNLPKRKGKWSLDVDPIDLY